MANPCEVLTRAEAILWKNLQRSQAEGGMKFRRQLHHLAASARGPISTEFTGCPRKKKEPKKKERLLRLSLLLRPQVSDLRTIRGVLSRTCVAPYRCPSETR